MPMLTFAIKFNRHIRMSNYIMKPSWMSRRASRSSHNDQSIAINTVYKISYIKLEVGLINSTEVL